MPSVLLVKTSSLGDVVHNLPVATDLARKMPGVRIDWLVEEGFAAIPRLHPAVGEVIPVALRRWRRALGRVGTWREMAAFWARLRSRRYDVVLDSQGLIKSALLARLALGHRRGYDSAAARESLAAHCYDQTFAIPTRLHAVERNRWLCAAALGYEPDLPLDYGLHVPPLGADWLPAAPWAVLLTATSRADKLWPEAQWIDLGAALAARGLACVLPGGSPPERERAARIAAALPAAVAAPPLGLDALAALLAGARLTVGLDTGLTHLAAAVGTPALALFCGSDPDRTGVLAPGRFENLGAPGQPPPLGQVVEAVDRLLS
ncbi:MAG: lipopolysaccharide heptosyltransferase I [Betaproteobacteria bacterium]|nr:lipopolysaccharide heptosyltransferase I [Betaproteobacteria bacterium]